MARLQAFLLELGHGFAFRPAALGRVTGARQG